MPSRKIMQSHGRDEPTSVLVIGLLSLYFLFCAHLSVKAFFPNPAFWLIGAAAIVAGGIWFLLNYNDTFGYFLAVFACSHVNFADNQGGLWPYVLCATFLVGVLLKYRFGVSFSSVPLGINFLIIVFFAHQIMGLVLNPYSLVSNIQALIIACAQVLAFYGCASFKMTGPRLRQVSGVWFAAACWVFISALNQKYHWLLTPSPMLPQRFAGEGVYALATSGTFGSSELFSEYFCIVFVLSLVLIAYSTELERLHLKIIFPALLSLIASASLLMAGSRAAIILAAAAAGYIALGSAMLTASVQNLRRLALLAGAAMLCAVLILSFGSFLSLEDTIDDFKSLDPSNMSIKSVISGDSINRDFVYEYGYRRLAEKSWWIGYGFNLQENNHESMGLQGAEVKDFHSLYLSLPIFYGWIGAAAYVALVLCTGLRSYMCYLKYRQINHYLVPIALGFAVVWGVFMIDQYKITVTRVPCYFLLTWFWLGWTHSVANQGRSK